MSKAMFYLLKGDYKALLQPPWPYDARLQFQARSLKNESAHEV